MKNAYIYLEVTDSTNNELKRRLSEGVVPEEYTVISAGTQTAGRGRSGHEWVSPAGVSISTSMICYPLEHLEEEDEKGTADFRETQASEEAASEPEGAAEQDDAALYEGLLPGLTIVAAVAVVRAIEGECHLPAQIKWPNDILIEKRKVCGILTERIESAVIVGIGLNVRRGSYPTSLLGRATCLEEEIVIMNSRFRKADLWSLEESEEKTGAEPAVPSNAVLTERIWNGFRILYQQFLRERSLSFLLKEYNERLLNRDQRVRILDPAGQYEADALGMDEAGRLVVVLPETREKRRIDSGEVQVRGVDGYV